MTAVLEVSNLRKAFGGVIAVDGVSFEVRQGEMFRMQLKVQSATDQTWLEGIVTEIKEVTPDNER